MRGSWSRCCACKAGARRSTDEMGPFLPRRCQWEQWEPRGGQHALQGPRRWWRAAHSDWRRRAMECREEQQPVSLPRAIWSALRGPRKPSYGSIKPSPLHNSGFSRIVGCCRAVNLQCRDGSNQTVCEGAPFTAISSFFIYRPRTMITLSKSLLTTEKMAFFGPPPLPPSAERGAQAVSAVVADKVRSRRRSSSDFEFAATEFCLEDRGGYTRLPFTPAPGEHAQLHGRKNQGRARGGAYGIPHSPKKNHKFRRRERRR